MVKDFLDKNASYQESIPEVANLAALIASQDMEDRANKLSTALTVATEAVAKAVAEAKRIEMCEWIAKHGSTLLRYRLNDGHPSMVSLYEDERLALEHPSWRWGGDMYRSPQSRAPTLAEYEVLDRVKATVPDAVLGLFGGEYVPMRTFMGRNIYLPLDRFYEVDVVL